MFGTTPAALVSSSKNQIIVTVPSISNGNYNVTVTDSRGHVSNTVPFTILAAKLIPITFTVNNATPTVSGDYILMTTRWRYIDDTLQKFDREIIVTFLLNDVKHLIKRNSRSQQVLLKIEDTDLVRTTEQEVRNLFPVCGLKS